MHALPMIQDILQLPIMFLNLFVRCALKKSRRSCNETQTKVRNSERNSWEVRRVKTGVIFNLCAYLMMYFISKLTCGLGCVSFILADRTTSEGSDKDYLPHQEARMKAGLEKAIQHKDKLLEFDKNGWALTNP